MTRHPGTSRPATRHARTSPPGTGSPRTARTGADPAADRPAPVGVVVITRNRRDRLLRTLDRLAALPERPPVVVVDNGSTDGTADAARARHPSVRVLRLPRNEGAAARNRGAAALDTPLVAFCDDDSWWPPGALADAAVLFDAHPRLGLLAAAIRVEPGGAPDPMNALLASSPLGTAPDLPGPSVLGFIACAAVVRRDAFLAAGGFHPLLHFAGEETLLAIDLAARGWGLAHCPAVTAHHQPGAAPKPGRAARLRRNAVLTIWMRRPWPRVLAATARLARDAARDADARAALADTLPRLPAALRHRRRIPLPVERDLRTLDDGTGAPAQDPRPGPPGRHPFLRDAPDRHPSGQNPSDQNPSDRNPPGQDPPRPTPAAHP